jgi:hypothetical protein
LASLHTHATLPAFYFLPKIHKLRSVARACLPHLRGRPIVASPSWITTPASAWLADVLNGACAAAYPQVLPDSRALVMQLEASRVVRESYLVTFDVVSMYPSLDVPSAITACAHTVGVGQRQLVQSLLRFVLDGNYFTHSGAVFQQIQGGAMGTPCMPPVANIYMAYWVEQCVRAATPYWPSIYRRFIDDGFLVWEQDRPSLLAFLAALNAAMPGIQLTWQVSTTSIAYMDLVITKDLSLPGDTVPLLVSTYQKPHNRYLYLPAFSFHRAHTFAGFVRGELIRYAVTNTSRHGFECMKRRFMERLLQRGYSKAWLSHLFAQVSHASRHAHLQASQRRRRAAGQPQPPVFVATHGLLEASGRLSHVINGVYERHQGQPAVQAAMAGAPHVTVAFRAPPSIGARLVRARM